jgi:hypothetical protein
MTARHWLGLVFVAAVVAVVLGLLERAPGARTLSRRLWDHTTGTLHGVEVRFPSRPRLELGNPVYTIEDQAFALCGRVVTISTEAPWTVGMDLDPTVLRRFDSSTRAVAMKPGRGLAWIIRTLMPPPLRKEFIADLEELWRQEGPGTLEALRDPVVALLGDLSNVLSDSFPVVLAKHRPALERFVNAVKHEIYPEELKPLVDHHLVPALQARLEGVAAQVGTEVWKSIAIGDVLGLLWTGTKEMVGLADEEDIRRDFAVVVRERALPVLQRRGPELLDAAVQGFRDIWSTEPVQQAVDEAAWRILRDERFQSFVQEFLRDWLLHNPPLSARVREALRSQDLRAPIAAVYEVAEPMLEDYLEEMLTRPDREGMDHQLVRVLRSIVLKKDKRYIVLIPGPGGEPIAPGVALEGIIGEDR